MHPAWYTLLLTLPLFISSTPVLALDVGQSPGKVPLTTLAGDTIAMENYAERPATAVLFLSSRCPATAQAIDEINKLYAKFRHRDVLVVGVAANAAETDDELGTFAQRRGLIFPVYRDRDGAVAKQFGATLTPEVFLLDKRGGLVFHGSLGDEKGRTAYDAAVLSVLRKQPVAAPQGPLVGTPLATVGEKPTWMILTARSHSRRSWSSRKFRRAGAPLLDDLRSGEPRPALPVVWRHVRIGARPNPIPRAKSWVKRIGACHRR